MNPLTPPNSRSDWNPVGLGLLPIKHGSPTVAMPGYDVQIVDEAAKRTGQHTQQRADKQADGHRDERARERVDSAKHHAREHVSACDIRAEEVRSAGWLQRRGGIARDGIVWGEEAGEQHPQHSNQQHQPREHDRRA